MTRTAKVVSSNSEENLTSLFEPIISSKVLYCLFSETLPANKTGRYFIRYNYYHHDCFPETNGEFLELSIKEYAQLIGKSRSRVTQILNIISINNFKNQPSNYRTIQAWDLVPKLALVKLIIPIHQYHKPWPTSRKFKLYIYQDEKKQKA